MPSSAHERILELCDLLERANHAYFVEAAPIMPDSEYDALLEDLIALEAAHPQYRDPNSPSQRVSGEPIDAFRTVAHARTSAPGTIASSRGSARTPAPPTSAIRRSTAWPSACGTSEACWFGLCPAVTASGATT